MYCGPEGIRTLNPLHAMEVRYRYATGPIVDSEGIEPSPMQCECIVLPLNYEPFGQFPISLDILHQITEGKKVD